MSEMTPESTPAPTPQQAEMAHEETMAREHLTANPQEMPEQFGGDVDKFMASWKEQRAALTRSQQEVAELRGQQPVDMTPQETLSEAPPVVDSLSIPEAPEVAVDDMWAAAAEQLSATGDVDAATRTRLTESGVPEGMIDGYITGMKAQQAQSAQLAAAEVGGTEQLQSIIQWATDNLSGPEREAANAALNGPNWKLTLLGIKAQMGAAAPMAGEPGPGPALTGTQMPSLQAYQSQQEMTQAIGDPRYGVDPQYTEFVQNRIRITSGNAPI